MYTRKAAHSRITGTKANAECVWTVAGQAYYFCCPPCVDEFVTWAKEEPEKVRPPESYTQE